ncbi:MAG: hypothetical protein ACOCZK_07295 [Planctomycetota bacterium]
MASPEQIYRVYAELHANAQTVRDFQVAAGERVSGTVQLLLAGDRARLLARWGDEMTELCGVLDGSHADPYILEATQVFYWASLYAVTAGVSWEELHFVDLRQQAAAARIESVDRLRSQAQRLVDLGPERAGVQKPFLLWWIADGFYRAATPMERQWTLEQLMEYDLQEMKKRPYLAPILDRVEA